MKIAIVTGASSGMGREFVRQLGYFYKNLDEIWVIARRKERLEALAKESRVPLRIFAGDLQKKKVYKELRDALEKLQLNDAALQFEKEQPDLRMLVNSAGFGKSGSVEEILSEKFRIQTDMVDVNCRSLTRMTLLCLPFLRAGSRIVNLASASAFCPQPYFSVYAATKSYVLSFSRSLGEELRKKGIVVTAVCPGPVDTEFFKFSGKPQNILKKLTMAKADRVVHQALKDCRSGKSVSVYGIPMKLTYFGTKLLPHGFLVRMQQI